MTSHWRWWGAIAGVGLGLVDTLTVQALGLTFALNGRPAGWLAAGFFGTSFATLGWLVGALLEGRRRDRAQAAVIQGQIEALAGARARLAENQRLASLGQLAAAIAHEVRNPLGVIRSAAQGIAESAAPEDTATARASGFIVTEVDRLTSVVASLLAFVRPLTITRQSVPVAPLLDRALALVAEELSAKGLGVRRDDTDALPPLRGNADLICQVLLGLLSNAADATAPGGAIELGARHANGAVELAVRDSGPGVPPDLRERIFDPFFTTRPHGTGLGLAVARQIVEAHGGRIDVGDRPGGGACFTVRLPLADIAA